MTEVQEIRIRRPDDWHLHLRDGKLLHATLSCTARQFERALVMPNLVPPITSVSAVRSYKHAINDALVIQGIPFGIFKPLMTIYLTDNTKKEDVWLAKDAGVVAAKLYPANATTNSASGVTDIKKLQPIFEAMSDSGLALCIHGETLMSPTQGDVTRGGRVGQLRREAVFLKETLEWIVRSFPFLKITLEHITTKEAVEFVDCAPENVVASITAHHLLATLDDALESHHNKCMPVLKEEPHRQALLDAATSGNPKFFGGTDSAPHAKSKKETACGCAGCFTALHAVELYATAFEERNALDRLEGFLSVFGALHYGFPLNDEDIVVRREEWVVPFEIPFGDEEVLVPFWAGRTLNWKVVD